MQVNEAGGDDQSRRVDRRVAGKGRGRNLSNAIAVDADLRRASNPDSGSMTRPPRITSACRTAGAAGTDATNAAANKTKPAPVVLTMWKFYTAKWLDPQSVDEGTRCRLSKLHQDRPRRQPDQKNVSELRRPRRRNRFRFGVNVKCVSTTVFTPARAAIFPTSSGVRCPRVACVVIPPVRSLSVIACHRPSLIISFIRASNELTSETSRSAPLASSVTASLGPVSPGKHDHAIGCIQSGQYDFSLADAVSV